MEFRANQLKLIRNFKSSAAMDQFSRFVLIHTVKGRRNVFEDNEDMSSCVLNFWGQHLKIGHFQGFTFRNRTFSRLCPQIWCGHVHICSGAPAVQGCPYVLGRTETDVL